MLCVAAGVVWFKLDREEKEKAQYQRQLDAERAEFRQHEFAAIKAFHQFDDQMRKETAAANARTAEIKKEMKDEKDAGN